MLTVDYSRLGLRPGERLLDLGCGGGRHAYEALKRGAKVVAVDANRDELSKVIGVMAAMLEAGELSPSPRQERDLLVQRSAALAVQAPEEVSGAVLQGDALRLPFADGTFDRVIAAEVLEHIPQDRIAISELARVLRDGGRLAVTVPRFGPELVNWALSDAYHNVEGGHVRIYRRSVLLGRLAGAGLKPVGCHYAHALHSPYWWLRCLVGPEREDHLLVSAYHRLLVWDITDRPLVTRLAERALNPLMGKSLVVYLEKAA
ncbi:MAG: methyltransferase domain-containing protein [Actinobacteria bacterium]|nr:methyltransferase domain-containing protein [Actinomycetota bacterium]